MMKLPTLPYDFIYRDGEKITIKVEGYGDVRLDYKEEEEEEGLSDIEKLRKETIRRIREGEIT